ncbi:MAG TPA: hemolysin III family protein [bacterium]|nr:hemolysin III family protein [bacterium]
MTAKKIIKPYSTGEEISHSITHGIGTALSIAGLAVSVVMAARTGDALKVLSFVIFGTSMILLYTASTLYHSFTHVKTKNIFRYMDHIAIFILIAGTYTPIALILLKGAWGWTLFGLAWGFAIAGIVYQAVFLNRFKWISISIYLGMGWLAVVAIQPLMAVMPFGLFLWILAGGLFYTLGSAFYLIDNIKFFHFVWHLFVIAGTVCHFFGLILYLL